MSASDNDEAHNNFPENRWGAPIGDGLIHLHDHDFDYEDYFKRYGEDMPSDERSDFSARVYGLICRDFYKSGGDPGAIPAWAMGYLVDKLHQVLGGVPWDEIMGLTWEPTIPPLSPLGQRAFRIYAYVHNTQLDRPDTNTTDAIAEAASKNHVSYETARAAYYAMKKAMASEKWLEHVPPNFLNREGGF